MTTIYMPHELKKGGNSDFINQLYALCDEPEINLDFSTLNLAFPISTLKIGASIRNLVRHRKAKGLETFAPGISSSNSCHSYLMHVGYFKFIGLDIGNSLGEAHGSSTYLPITKLNALELNKEAAERNTTLQGMILEKATSISNILMGHDRDANIDLVTYALKEVIRNTFEHSNSQDCYLYMQKYRDNAVQLAIFDEGIGVKESLNKKYAFKTHSDAIKEAIQPGISCADLDKNNTHGNSGYGLYVLSELGREFGWFEMSSGDCSFMLNNSGSTLHTRPLQLGTFVGVDFTNTRFNMNEKLEEIIEGGQQLARAQGNNYVASSSSRGLHI